MSNQKIITTHSGRFHADESFGVAVLKIVYPDSIIVRTRDIEKIRSSDIVLDVGGEYDESKDRFDHHQFGGAGIRENKIPYASFGLVWKKYGEHVSGSKEVADIIEKWLVLPIDGMDNGLDISKPIFSGINAFMIQDALFLFSPTWQEKDRTFDSSFFEALPIVELILKRVITHAQAQVVGNSSVQKAYDNAEDKRVVVLDDRYLYQDVLCAQKEPLFVIIPDSQMGQWKVEIIPETPETFTYRKKLPVSWAGLRDEDLVRITGVSDALFCHNARFMVVARSKEGAVKLAKLALKD